MSHWGQIRNPWDSQVFAIVHIVIGLSLHIHSFIHLSPYAAAGYFGQYKMVQKSWKMIETLAHGYSSESTHQELPNIAGFIYMMEVHKSGFHDLWSF